MTSRWSHAGGVVVRVVGDELQYLLVHASDNPEIWLLPKGHIEKGETPEAAAVREVKEEAGVSAAIIGRAGESRYEVKGKAVRVVFYLMKFQAEVAREETRDLAWRNYEEAMAMLHFENTRHILKQAHALNN